MTRIFTWSEFDESVNYIANKCKNENFSGVYGVPRGGLCLAVALSHKLNIQFLDKPLKNSLIVDDILETGLTLDSYRNIKGANFFVLFSKKEPLWWNTVNLYKKKEWVFFPWENKKNTINEKKQYKMKRGLN